MDSAGNKSEDMDESIRKLSSIRASVNAYHANLNPISAYQPRPFKLPPIYPSIHRSRIKPPPHVQPTLAISSTEQRDKRISANILKKFPGNSLDSQPGFITDVLNVCPGSLAVTRGSALTNGLVSAIPETVHASREVKLSSRHVLPHDSSGLPVFTNPLNPKNHGLASDSPPEPPTFENPARVAFKSSEIMETPEYLTSVSRSHVFRKKRLTPVVPAFALRASSILPFKKPRSMIKESKKGPPLLLHEHIGSSAYKSQTIGQKFLQQYLENARLFGHQVHSHGHPISTRNSFPNSESVLFKKKPRPRDISSATSGPEPLPTHKSLSRAKYPSFRSLQNDYKRI